MGDNMKKYFKYILLLIIIILVLIIYFIFKSNNNNNKSFKLNENLVFSKNIEYTVKFIDFSSNFKENSDDKEDDKNENTKDLKEESKEDSKDSISKKEKEKENKKEATKNSNDKNKKSETISNQKRTNNKEQNTSQKYEQKRQDTIESQDKKATESKVTTETEEKTESSTGKYNITINTTTVYTYEIDKNGNKKIINKKVKNTKYDYSTFKATTNDLKPEAQGLVSSNAAQYNEMLEYVNNLRSENGSSPLTLDGNLNLAATIRALEMAWSSKFSHTRPDGRSCFTIFNDLGLSAGMAGENIAGGSTSTKYVFDMWDKSEGHHNNMINPNFTKIGVGKATVNGATYWVQLFS